MFSRVKAEVFAVASVLAILSGNAPADDAVRIDRLSAEFTMKRTLKVLTDTIESSGRLTLGGPGLLRWDTTKPAQSVLVINRDRAWMHYPKMGLTRDFSLGDDPVMSLLGEHLLALTTQNFDEIGRLYDVVDADRGAKKLTPKDAGVKSVFKYLRVNIDDKGVVSQVEITSLNGDVTLIEFKNVQINPNLSPALFEKPTVREDNL